MFVVRIVQVRHFSSVYYGVCSDYLLVMQGQIITWLWNLLEGTSSDYILRTYNYANILRQRGESMSRLVSFLTSMSIDYKMKTRLNIISGDEHQHMINYSSKYIDEIFRYVINSEKIIAKPNQPNELTVSHLHSYIGWRGYIKGLGSMSAEERMAASAKGYENGLGAMSAEERMAASAKGYENGLGAMSAEERMAAREKGFENGIGASMIKWDRKYAEFESYDGLPERGTTLDNWQETQLGNRPSSLNAKIRKEIDENKGSTIWSDRRVKLFDCVEQKNRTKRNNAWERKYAVFESYDGMPKKGTPLYNWQENQLSNTHGSCLNAKIQKEIEENKGSTIFRDQKVKLFNCVEQKRRE